jgi:hypothetical protein
MMPTHDLEPLIASIPGLADARDWLSRMPGCDRSYLQRVLARKDVPSAVDIASEAIRGRDFGKAANWLALALWCHQNRSIDELRRRGLFRSSKYEFDLTYLTPILHSLLCHASSLQLSQDVRTYLRSSQALLRFSPRIRRLHLNAVSFILKYPHFFVKTVLALLDSKFMAIQRATSSAGDLASPSVEDYAEAASYLISLFNSYRY